LHGALAVSLGNGVEALSRLNFLKGKTSRIFPAGFRININKKVISPNQVIFAVWNDSIAGNSASEISDRIFPLFGNRFTVRT
jgi:hypothetical protein